MTTRDMDELEKTHVEGVYNEIAPHFTHISHTPWPKVKQFIKNLETGAFVADIGCGNGRYLNINKRVWKLGSDRCEGLVKIAGDRGHDVLVADNLHLPYRDNLFDALISVAVIHHFSTVERRIQALKELCRIVRPGGRLLICVWAFEQKHRRFDGQDVLVPWTKPNQRSRCRGNKFSHSNSSDVSSTSSISEDEVTHDSILTEQQTSGEKSGDTTSKFTADNSSLANTYSRPNSSRQNGEEKWTLRDHLSKGNKYRDDVNGLSCEQTPPVRPSTLRLLHRNTRYVSSQHTRYKQQTEKLQQFKSQVSKHNGVKDPSTHLNHSFHKTANKGSQHMPGQRISIKSLCSPPVENRKIEAVPVLTVPNVGTRDTIPTVPDTTKQPTGDTTIHPIEDTSILLKLKTFFMPKTKVSEHVKKKKDKLSWLDYYRNCAKDLEEDLTSFKSFCRLLNSENKHDNLSREFIVRQFPESSQSCGKDAIVIRNSFESHVSARRQCDQPAEDTRDQLGQPLASLNQISGNHLLSLKNYLSCSCSQYCGKRRECLQHSSEDLKSSTLKLQPCAQCTKHGANHHLPCALQYKVSAQSTDPIVQYPRPPDGEWLKTSHIQSQNGMNKEISDVTEVNHPCDEHKLCPSTIKQEMNTKVDNEEVFEDLTSSLSACLTNLSKASTGSSSQNMSLQRYYHVFKEGELEALICTHVPELTIIHSYFDHANWCLIAEKQS